MKQSLKKLSGKNLLSSFCRVPKHSLELSVIFRNNRYRKFRKIIVIEKFDLMHTPTYFSARSPVQWKRLDLLVLLTSLTFNQSTSLQWMCLQNIQLPGETNSQETSAPHCHTATLLQQEKKLVTLTRPVVSHRRPSLTAVVIICHVSCCLRDYKTILERLPSKKR